MKMRWKKIGTTVLLGVLCGISQTRSAENGDKADRMRLIGAWHLVSMVGPDGKQITTGLPVGMLIYTRDGHMSVQLMYPQSQKSLSNEYIENGYEASFGSYNLDEATHTVTHHIQGANTGDRLVDKDLPRAYRFIGDGKMVITSARSDEHWSVTWQHY
jgi:Lipocalin-like domain